MSELLQELLRLEASLLELALRGTLVYWALFVLFRTAGRRNIGGLGFADLVVVMLVASAVGDSLGGGATTLLDGTVVAATVVFWSALLDRLCYFVPAMARLVEPSPVRLVENGRLLLRNMRREYVTRDELMEQLRLNGIASLQEVQAAFLEANGEISVITRDSPPVEAAPEG